MNLGCKGVGRFTWLKVFDDVKVESIFQDKDGKMKKRSFIFRLDDNDTISNLKLEDVDSNERETIITLKNFASEKYRIKSASCKTIAKKIIEHALIYLTMDTCPNIVINDYEKKEVICVNDYYNNEIKLHEEEQSVKITSDETQNKFEFKVKHMKFNAIWEKENNKIIYCGNNRGVVNKFIKDRNLSKIIENRDSKFLYYCIVTGKLLDDNVNSERTAFTLPRQDNMFELCFDTIDNEVNNIINEYLKNELEYKKSINLERVSNYIDSERPQYKHLKKYNKKELEEISADTNEKELEKILHMLDYDNKKSIKEELEEKLNDSITKKELDEIIEEYSEKINDNSKSSLAEYILSRKVVLDIFEKSTWRNEEDGSFELEKVIHNLIFPMSKISDDIDYTKHNLWLIDERLSYHYYLASDKSFKNNELTASDNGKRPDIIIYDKPIALANTDNYNRYDDISIFEFKKPGLDNYSAAKNPVEQVIEYVKELKTNDSRDKKGRPMNIDINTKFRAYIIADITDSLYEILGDRGFNITTDKQEAVTYIDRHNLYIEIMSFNKLVTDSKKRNQILFDKLLV